MPLNQSKPPLSFLLYSAFAFFFLPLFLPPSLGHWCQTDLLCAGVCFCSSMPVCICTDECMCGCAAASQDVRFICCVNVCMYLYFWCLHMCSCMYQVSIPWIRSLVSWLFHSSVHFHRDPSPACIFLSFVILHWYWHTNSCWQTNI